MTVQEQNIDAAEVAKFDALASRWWDPSGEFKPLHAINPLRLDFIRQRAQLEGRDVLDVGCGGGILAESMAKLGARVTGIDAAEGPLTVARLHQAESGTDVTYQHTTAEALAEENAAGFDVVTCLEMLEHVPSPIAVIDACRRLVKPGGDVFFSTINRNPKAFLFAIVGAEYILRLLPTGTHEYDKFIRPSELAEWSRKSGLTLQDSTGMHYNPLSEEYSLGPNVDVNYLMHFQRPADE
jgi:2-polyprenyl-6-hydroxyphenyl methylase/3-demethylubiquinone-9 3-methyltransferase